MTQSASPAAPRAGRLTALTRAKLLYATAGMLSLVASVALWFSGAREQGVFVGLWVPTIFAAGAMFTNGGHHE